MPPMPAARHGDLLTVFAATLAMAVAMTWPLILSPASLVPNDVGDPILNTWILWWNAGHAPLSTAWWNAPIFFPAAGTLAFSEHLLGLTFMSSPVIWLTGSPLLAYNVTFLLTFPLSATAAYLLGFELTGRRSAALVCAAAFGFAPYRMAQLAHLQILASFWMPLALFALHRYLRVGASRWLVLFAAAWVGQALSNGYFLAFFPVLLALWCLWFVRDRRWQRWSAITLAWVAGVVVVLPVLLGYQSVHATYNLTRNPLAPQRFAADVAAWLDASPLLALWGRLDWTTQPEGQLFTGVTVLLVIVAGLVVRRSRPAKSTLIFYVLAAMVMYVFALGPKPALLGEPFLSTGPYAWLAHLPGISALRVPARFATLMVLCVAAAAGVGVSIVTSSWQPARRRLAAGLIVAAIVAEGWPARVPLWEPPRAWNIQASEIPGALLVLPIVNAQNEVAALYRGMAHGRPIVNGYSGHRPPWYLPMLEALDANDPEILDELARAGVTQIAIVRRQDPGGAWAAFAESRATLARVSVEDGFALYNLPRPADAAFGASGHAIAIAAIEASLNPFMIPALTDDDSETFWFTRSAQAGGEWLVVDVGKSQPIAAVELALGGHATDYPRELVIEVSDDRATWSEVWRGRGAAPAIAAAFRPPATIPIQFTFAPRTARFVRLTQTGRHDSARWTVVRLRVLSPAPSVR